LIGLALDKRPINPYIGEHYDTFFVRADGIDNRFHDDEHDGTKSRAGSREDTET